MTNEWTLAYLHLVAYFLQYKCFLFCIGSESYHLITIIKGKKWWGIPFKNKDTAISIFFFLKKTAFAFRKNSKILDWPIGILLHSWYSVIVFIFFSPSVLELFIYFFISFWRLQIHTQAEKGEKNSNSGNRTRTSMISQSRYWEGQFPMTGKKKSKKAYLKCLTLCWKGTWLLIRGPMTSIYSGTFLVWNLSTLRT